eukprot:COSAG06_NODE_953_length_11329_cov_5.438825_10_plen_241_part_00
MYCTLCSAPYNSAGAFYKSLIQLRVPKCGQQPDQRGVTSSLRRLRGNSRLDLPPATVTGHAGSRTRLRWLRSAVKQQAAPTHTEPSRTNYSIDDFTPLSHWCDGSGGAIAAPRRPPTHSSPGGGGRRLGCSGADAGGWRERHPVRAVGGRAALLHHAAHHFGRRYFHVCAGRRLSGALQHRLRRRATCSTAACGWRPRHCDTRGDDFGWVLRTRGRPRISSQTWSTYEARATQLGWRRAC